jgi:hypothetical protein
MERDFVGYADTPPVVPWPNGARLAVQVSVSYEEGAEYSLLDGPRQVDIARWWLEHQPPALRSWP